MHGGGFSLPELNIQVCCYEVVQVWEGKVVEGRDVEEVVRILHIPRCKCKN